MPSARSIERINPGLRRGNCNAPRSDARARSGSARQLQRRIELAQIRKSGHEAEQVYRIRPRRMARDQLLNRKTYSRCDRLEIHPVVADGNHMLASRAQLE